MIEFVYILAGAVVGGVITALFLRGKSDKDIAVLKEKLNSSGEKLALLEQARQDLGKEFENLANRIFDDKSIKSKANLNEILNPFKEQLGEFKKKVEDVYVNEGKQRQSLLKEIEHLKELNNQISKEAVDLTNALKGKSKTRGNWGELVLERVLELSGLERGREYETQVHLKEKYGGGQGRFPDVIVHLPEKRDVVIDSKVSLNDYERYCSADDDVDRDLALKEHVAAVRRHMTELSAKNYQELEGINPLEQVVMCIPNEPAYITAASEDPKLHEDAMKNHILVVGPNTLVLTLKIISAMWRTYDQSRNALNIAERGQRLYEKFVGFVDDIEGIEKDLKSAAKSCDEAKSKLIAGPGNLVGQAEKLIELGVKAKKNLSQSLVQQSDREN